MNGVYEKNFKVNFFIEASHFKLVFWNFDKTDSKIHSNIAMYSFILLPPIYYVMTT